MKCYFLFGLLFFCLAANDSRSQALLVNVALASNGATVVTSSSYNSAYAAVGAIDGDRRGESWGAGGGWNDATANTFPDWLEVDFNGTRTIQEIDVFTVQDNYESPIAPTPAMTFSQYGLTDFQAQYWDGLQWLPVPGGAVVGNDLVWRKFSFSPLSTIRIRVLVNGALNAYSRITEIEAYGIAGGAATNQVPTVVLGSPGNNAAFSAPATVVLNATASDSDGSISKVEFYSGTTLVATSTSLGNPYTAVWNNVPPGNYTITAVATDDLGATAASSPANAVVSSAGVVNLALASKGGTAAASSSYNSAYAAVGAIDGDRKGQPWGAGGGWNDATANTFPDWLQVDLNGTRSIQEIDVFTVQDNYRSPIDPTPAMTFSQYGLTDFQVQYWDGVQWLPVPGGVVAGNNLVWRKFSFSPLSTNRIRVLVNGALHAYSRIAEIEAYGTAGGAATNQAPTVVLGSPSNNAAFSAPAVVALSATASDSDGSISKVEFYSGTTLVATSTSLGNPYTAVWNNVPAGNYTITAVATDNFGATAASSPANAVVSTVGLVNLALASNGGTVVASSSYSNGYAAVSVIDGDRKGQSWGAGGGWNDATANAFPDWLEVDFNGTRSIREIDVFTVQDNYESPTVPTPAMTFSQYGLTDFQVQYWDGLQWLPVPGGVVAGNNRVWRKFSFSPLTATRIRLLVHGALNAYSRITEIEAYGAAGANSSVVNVPPAISGVQIFPANYVWNTPVDSLPVQRAINIINDHGGHNLHPDFGTTYNGLLNGIPVNVVPGNSTPKVQVRITSYASESDALPGGDQHSGFLPIPVNVAIENDPVTSATWSAGDDHHLLIIDSDTHTLHELYSVTRQPDGTIVSDSYSHWDLGSSTLRPDSWTSSDAAGLSVTSGLVSYDQLRGCLSVDPQGSSCTLGHALRFTLDLTHGPHIWPARHDANSGGLNNPPFGLRVRLKSAVDTSTYSPTNRIILNTLKKYGAILADNGGDWFFQGVPDSRWNDNDLHDLAQIVPADSFEVVDTSKWMVDFDSGEADPNGSGLPVVTWPKPGAVLALDFDDPANIVTAIGFRSFPLAPYSQSLGYGWQSTNGMGWRNRSSSSDPLWRDIAVTEVPSTQTLLVDLPNGSYSVTIFLGDPEWPNNQGLTVSAENVVQFTLAGTSPAQALVKTFPVTVSDGQLTLQFGPVAQNYSLAIAGIEIDPVVPK